YESLAFGITHRVMTPQDLNIPDPPVGADPLTAAGFAGDDRGRPLSAAPAAEVLAAAALGNAGHVSGCSALFVFSGGLPVTAGTVGQDANVAGPKTGFESHSRGSCPGFAAGLESWPSPF